MNILVTGASGLIGRAAAMELMSRGHAVRGLQRSAAPPELRGVESFVADVTAPAARWAAEAADAVLHLAGRGDVSESWQAPGRYLNLIVGGTLNILKGARAGGAAVVIPSTQRVYRPARRPLRETDRPRPTDPYALARLMAEHFCRLYSERYRISTRAVRLFSVYGPGQRGQGNSGVVAIFLERAHDARDLVVEAGPRRDLTHVDDVARGLCLTLERAQAGFRIYNLATGRGTSLEALAQSVVRCTASASRVVPPASPWRGGDLVADLHRARAELEYEPQISLDEGLQRLVATSGP